MLGWGKEKKAAKEPEKQQPAGPAKASGSRPAAAKPPESAPPASEQAPAPTPHVSGSGVHNAPTPVVNLEHLLLDAGLITAEQLDAAVAEQAKRGGFVGQILIDLKFLDDNALTSFMAKHCRIPHLSLLDYLIDKDILGLVPQDICMKYSLLPIDRLGKNLTIAMVNPLDDAAMAAVRAACPELRIKPILCAYNHYLAVAAKVFVDMKGPSADLSASSFGLRSFSKPKSSDAASEPQEAPAAEAAQQAEPLAKGEPAKAEGEADVGSFVDFVVEPVEEKVETPAESPHEDRFEGESLLSTIFGKSSSDVLGKAIAEPDEVQASVGRSPSDSSLLVRSMISMMQDSMCDTYAVLARRLDLFKGMNPADVAKIFARGMTTEFEAGTVIFEKGDKGDELYVILSGQVEIYDGAILFATLSKGDMFGEMALVSNEPRSASARTIEMTSMLVLSNDAIHNVLSKEAAIQILENIIVTLSQRLRTANQMREHEAVRL